MTEPEIPQWMLDIQDQVWREYSTDGEIGRERMSEALAEVHRRVRAKLGLGELQ